MNGVSSFNTKVVSATKHYEATSKRLGEPNLARQIGKADPERAGRSLGSGGFSDWHAVEAEMRCVGIRVCVWQEYCRSDRGAEN